MRTLAHASEAVDLEPSHAKRTSKTLATGFGGPAAPPAIAGYESTSSAVDILLTINRNFNATSGGGSNVNSGGQSRRASVAIGLEPPHAKRTSTGVTTEFEGQAVPPAIEAYESKSSAVDTLRKINRDFNAISGGRSNVKIIEGSTVKSLRQHFDKDVKESGRQKRDHRATRGSTKQHTRACAKATENKLIHLKVTCSRFTPI
jgi:hypothetical protein